MYISFVWPKVDVKYLPEVKLPQNELGPWLQEAWFTPDNS